MVTSSTATCSSPATTPCAWSTTTACTCPPWPVWTVPSGDTATTSRPCERNDDFGADLDHFSAWVIFLSLKAIAADPALWNRLHEPKGEFLLLTEDDFRSPSGSTGLQTLLAHPDRTVSGLADQVRSLAFQPLDVLPPLTGAVPEQRTAATGATRTAASGADPALIPGTGGLPGWMAGHVPEQVPPPSVGPSVASLDGFRVRTPLDVVTAVLWPLMLATTVLIVVAEFSAPLIGPGVPIAVAVVFTAFAWSRRVERAQSRAVLAQLTNELDRLENPAKAAEKLRKDRAKFDAAETKRTAAHPRAQDKLTAQYHAELKGPRSVKSASSEISTRRSTASRRNCAGLWARHSPTNSPRMCGTSSAVG
ncbi:hypothetical protein SHKM778_33410 [Streptomyces sp. KM77-8]|uniref:Uncharacterized protein n=1 Tax=Streptomyces haneummycinicus TaxID=3074435 RepID=A0AAT9HI08_9ACTN